MNEPLPASLVEKIEALCAEGDARLEEDDFDEALERYAEAWDLVPEPGTAHELSTWVLMAIADAAWLGRKLDQAHDALEYAARCPGAVGNPLFHLRFGQVQFELGNRDRAADELIRAWGLAGAEVFEDEDPKYLKFLRTRAKLETPKRAAKKAPLKS